MTPASSVDFDDLMAWPLALIVQVSGGVDERGDREFWEDPSQRDKWSHAMGCCR